MSRAQPSVLIYRVATSRCDVPAHKAGGFGADSTSADGAACRPCQFRGIISLTHQAEGAHDYLRCKNCAVIQGVS
jgi:hypothetical protein